MPTFEQASLVLSANSTVVSPIQVKLKDNKCFTVDAAQAVAPASGGPLTNVTYPNPFSIQPGTCVPAVPPAYRVATLQMNQAAIADWHGNFDNKRLVKVLMQITGGTVAYLYIALSCTQHP